ncbi:PepSY domain-containing protein [Oceanospirillum multiglobuliferum]|uniref:PepSY domain-containing protein n=1 Tax=Oceanospirillum multiglobuliferum TaxID=64969 RepID=UPI0014752B32|nr:hypothetical protein [Oceanospirillum multiglobuliferum]
MLADNLPSNVGDKPLSDTEQQYNSDNDDVTNKVERITWPFTRWVEERVQRSPMIRTPKGSLSKDGTSRTLDLRSAIKQASILYPGTVLNAEKQTRNGVATYLVRIISEEGVVKTITVNASNASDESK